MRLPCENSECIGRCTGKVYTCLRTVCGCLNEENTSQMRTCIVSTLDCADTCSLTLKFISRESHYWNDLLQVCVDICRDCERECARHEAAHCQECTTACRLCAEACEQYMALEVA